MQGLKPSQSLALERLYKRRYRPEHVFSHDQARELALLSRGIGRQIGLMIDRRGKVRHVIVGDHSSILIPELPPIPAHRTRDLRLLHTHLTPIGLEKEDLLDMLFLRLDAVIVLTVGDNGEPCQWQAGSLLAQGKEPYQVGPMKAWNENEWDFFTERPSVNAADQEQLSGRAVLISVSTDPASIQERNLDELANLAHTAGIEVGDRLVQRVSAINPQFILGKGKLAELEILALNSRADLLIFDGEILPSQLNNLAEVTQRKVIDRTQLILDIFAQHAVSKTGKLQVELAQLAYMQPRLTGRHLALDRLMGGVGGRGPGESRLELDRRKSRDRMGRLKAELKKIRAQRSCMRHNREKNRIPVVSLVGYTNAGKSTLLNALTDSSILTADKMFATLDPTARKLVLPGSREAVALDTVGFIRNLPQELMEAFGATLEELERADLLLHVADAASPLAQQQMDSVEQILEKLHLAEKPSLIVFNKTDQLSGAELEELKEIWPQAVFVSAKQGAGLDLLRSRIGQSLFGN